MANDAKSSRAANPVAVAADRRVHLLLALLAVVTMLAFWRVFGCQFVNWDDNVYVYENTSLASGLSPEGICKALTELRGGYWLPVTWFSLHLDYQLFGMHPWGYHLTNLLLHVANVLLAYLFFARCTGRPYASLFAAALFGLHPLRVESVAWVTERKDVLSTCLGLLAMLAYVRYAASARMEAPCYLKRIANTSYLLIVVFFTLSLLAKPMLVTLPCLLLLIDYWPLGRSGFLARSAENVPTARPVTRPGSLSRNSPCCCLRSAAASSPGRRSGEVGAVQTLAEFPLGTRTANAIVGYVRYLELTVAPMKLAALYPYSDDDLLPWKVALAGLALVAISALAVWQVRRRPYLFVGWFWFVGTLFPVCGLFQSGEQALADRFSYFPSLGLFLALTWYIADRLAALRWPVALRASLATVVLLFCAVVTSAQTAHWHDSVTLWVHTLKVTSRNGLAHHNLGEAYEKRRQLPAALAEIDRA